MKKLIAFLCALALMTPGALPAEAAPEKVRVQFHNEDAMAYEPETLTDRVRVTLNGEEMVFDVPAVTRSMDGMDGRTLVPVRPIAEALGATVLWMGENRQVIISTDERTIVLTLGSARAVVNGKNAELPGGVPAVVAKYGEAERTLVPLRFVSEQLLAQVDWDNDTFTAMVKAETASNGPLPPPGGDPALPPAGETPEPTPAPNAPDGMLARIAADDNAQSVTLYLNAPPRYRVTDLGDRVAIDLPGFVVGNGQDGSLTLENPVVERVRYAQHDTDVDQNYAASVRVVLDLRPGCTYADNVTVKGDENLWAITVTVDPPEKGTDMEMPELPESWDASAYTVVLDAGHGGSASGAVYEDVMEKNITLPVTLRAAELLREKGYNVVLTRDEDVYMDLYDRCDVANWVGADIFVSIHANASTTNRQFQGTFTYSYPGSVEGEKLAGAIQKAVVGQTGAIDRGLLTNDYVVLRETVMPAALLEMGFMSCPEELARLVRPEYREKVAQGVARGVEAYLATLPSKQPKAAPTPKPSPVPTPAPPPTRPGALEV